MIFMKNKTSKILYFRKNNGSILIGALIALVILSIFGIALLNFSETGIRNTVVEREYNAVYYIAESGINYAEVIIENTGIEVASYATTHEEFYLNFRTTLENVLNGEILTDFAPHFGSAPEAKLSVKNYELINTGEGTNFSQMLIRCEIESEGTIGERKRTLSTAFEISHKTFFAGGSIHPAFDYAFFLTGEETLDFPSGTSIEGDIYGNNVKLSSANSSIVGDIISLMNVDLSSGTKVFGDIYALGLSEDSGNVTLQSSLTSVTGNVNAKRNVTVKHGCTVGGNVFCDRDISLQSAQNSSQGILGNAYAGRNIYMQDKGSTNIGGVSYAGGKTNDHTPNNNRANIPPLIKPQYPSFVPIPAPPLTKFKAGSKDITLEPNWKNPNPQVIPPGSYGKLEITYGNTVRFTAGDYYFEEINGGESAIKIQLDFSNGPINIYVKEDVKFGSTLNFEVSENGNVFTNVRNLYNNNPQKAIEFAGMFYMEIHDELEIGPALSTWFGTTLVKEEFEIGSDALLIGSFVINGGEFKGYANLKVVYAPPTQSAAGIGTGSGPGGQPGSGEGEANIIVKIVKPAREK